MNPIAILVLVLILLRLAARLVLALLDRRHVRERSGALPPSLASLADPETFGKSVEYTLAKNGFGMVQETFSQALLLALLFSGLLPALASVLGAGPLGQAGFFVAALLLLELADLPLDWWRTFRLEERFGFNRNTPGLWAADAAKGMLVQAALTWPVVLLVLELASWLGRSWWLWGFAAVGAFQVALTLVYPRWIMPWFNTFKPLEEGGLKERLLKLAGRCAFPVNDLKVMDGSRRSRHSNAFFTGFGRFRRIVLFDTLLAQLDEAEVEAVLAHEIGHSKKGHTLKFTLLSLAFTLGGFALAGWLGRLPAFAAAFGLGRAGMGATLLLLVLCGPAVLFWISPLLSGLSRAYEYQADAFASLEAGVEGGPRFLISSLKKLQKENLGNLFPHPATVLFTYSHPPLVQRVARLESYEEP